MNSSTRIALAAGLLAFSGCTQIAFFDDGVPRPANSTLRTKDGPLVQAHRGGRHEFDDNAAGGFRNSLENGIRGFETDVRFTKDHELVIMHDAHANRTTEGTGLIEGMTLAEFKKLKLKRSQEVAPTAADVFAAFKGYDDFFIEIEMKAYPSEFYTPEVLEDYCRKLNALARNALPEGTYAFTCFNTNTLAMMRKVDERAPLGYIMWKPEDWQLDVAKSLKCCCVAPGLPPTDKAFVDKAHAAGFLVCLWMVQDVPAWAEAKAKGADRITSDYPISLVKAIEGASDEALDSPFRISAEADRLDGLYQVGETATFKLSARDSAGELVKSGKVTAKIGDFNGKVVRRETVDFAEANPFDVKVSSQTPGFLRLEANESVSGVGFSVDRLTCASTDASAPDTAMPQSWVAKEPAAKGRLPGRVVFLDRGASGPVQTPGRVTLAIAAAAKGSSPNVAAVQKLIRNFVARPEVDAARVDCFATGAGATAALAALAFEPSLKRGAILVPDFRENAKLAADLAHQVKVPVRFCVGFADNAISPDAAYAVYNACASKDKDILGGMGMKHEVFADYYDYVNAWSRGAELAKTQYRFLAFNIWGDYFGNPVGERMGEIEEVVRSRDPDVFGFQETTQRFWDSALIANLGRDYGIVGRGVGYQGRNVHTPLFYRKSLFELIDSGVVLYCPELDDSKGAVWAVVKDKRNGRNLVAFASHAWWRTDGQGDSWIRLHGSMMLHAKMTELAKKYDAAVIGGGDLNAPMSSQSLKYLVEHGYADAQASAEISPRRFPTEHGNPVRYLGGAYVGRNGATGHSLVRERSRYLDHIFYDPVKLTVKRFDLDISPTACRVSDHHPVIADFDFKD